MERVMSPIEILISKYEEKEKHADISLVHSRKMGEYRQAELIRAEKTCYTSFIAELRKLKEEN